MTQNGLGESFWDAHGIEIGACANFKKNVTAQDIDFPEHPIFKKF